MTTSTSTATRFHLSLNVRNLSRSVAFYRDLLGIEPSKRHERFARFTPDTPPLALSLVEKPGEGSAADAQQRLSHLGFRVDSPAELDLARQRMTRAGYALREEKGSRCCYAVQDKFWVTDPDGNEWEFYQLIEDIETSGAGSKGCCE